MSPKKRQMATSRPTENPENTEENRLFTVCIWGLKERPLTHLLVLDKHRGTNRARKGWVGSMFMFLVCS